MKTQIVEAVKAALGRSRRVKITFKKEAVAEVAYLLGMANSGIVKLEDNDLMNLMAVAKSGVWGHDNNRTTVVALTDQFDEDWFVSRLDHALEKIEVAD